ncbi:hypothetical protein EF294_03685 [Gordonia oryzae]|uniref:Uncharacterized protein n=1 Tax=Gordonia oryzae TaxID=2487349 RepID=A0A3N4H3D0_9ACTN|nr:hypothetical protein EF294_03685 [Gordonia oryzae]
MAHRPHDRDPEGSLRGSGYFDKSVDSIEVPSPPVVDPPPRLEAQNDGGSGSDATSYLNDFPD